MDIRRKHRWSNFISDPEVSCQADLYVPSSREELREVVRHACREGWPIRVAGRGHSATPLVPPGEGGILISLERLDRMLAVDTMSDPPTITVECGMTIRQLVDLTRRLGISLPSPTIYQDISIGGAIAAGAHGTGLYAATAAGDRYSRASTISDGVVGLALLRDGGQLSCIGHPVPPMPGCAEVDLSGRPDLDAAKLLPAAQVSLGTFGVLYAVTLACRRDFRLQVEDIYLPREEVLAGLDDILYTYEHVEIMWIPGSDVMLLKLMNPIVEDAIDQPPFGAGIRKRIDDGAVMAWGRGLLPLVSRYLPRVTPRALDLGRRFALRPGVRVCESSSAFHYHDAYPPFWDMSYAVDRKDAPRAWRAAIGLVEEAASRGEYPANIVLHSRYVSPSGALLSPAYGRETCFLEVPTCKVAARRPRQVQDFFDSFEQLMLAIPGARPHWGKYIIRGTGIGDRYPEIETFRRFRQFFDPRGRFLNRWLRQALAV